MGYADYLNHAGRPCGYAMVAVCDHPSCVKVIDRGYDYLCGTTGRIHDPAEPGCGRYFCATHRPHVVELRSGDCIGLCHSCYDDPRNTPFLAAEDHPHHGSGEC